VSLTLLVFAKQVPDTQNITGEAMKADGTVNRAALPAIFNPEDLDALELALQLKSKYGGKVVVATMGPPTATALLRQALFFGADETILLTDRKFAGADTLATSYTLACAARRFGQFDLILCGRQAIDGDTAQVGPQLAEKLGLPQLTYVESVRSIANGRIQARCQIEAGFEVVDAPLPALLTVVGDDQEPRPPSARRIMRYKKAMTRSELIARHGEHVYEDANVLSEEEERLCSKGLWIHEWNAGSIDADAERIGLAGSPTKVKQIESVVLGGSHNLRRIDATAEGVARLIHELVKEHILS